jgi:NH3-dependent NAD+ synthetase
MSISIGQRIVWRALIDLERRELHVRQRADRFNDIGSPKSAAGDRTVPIPAMLANIKARQRMIAQFALAGANRGLLAPIMLPRR